MASTNKTANYELSQFLGSDKPAWLGDYNTDMSKIDAQMKLNADKATGADGKADSNATAIGTLSSLTTEEKTNLVGAINEVDSHADTAQGTANDANTTAGQALTKANDIARYLAITDVGTPSSITVTGGSVTYSSSVRYASNADGTLGKLYGSLLGYHITSSSGSTITISGLPFDVDTEFTVVNAGMVQDTNNKVLYTADVTFKTNGTATISFPGNYNNLQLDIRLIPVLIFMQNFGDTPQPQ